MGTPKKEPQLLENYRMGRKQKEESSGTVLMTQRAQYGLIKEYALNGSEIPNMI